MNVPAAAPTIPSPPPGIRPVVAWVLLVAVIAVYVLRALPFASNSAQTIDETYHIGAAASLLPAGTLVLGVQHPPVPRYVMGLALSAEGVHLPEYHGATTSRKEDVAYAVGTEVLFGPAEHRPDAEGYWRRLLAVRWAMLLFPVLAMVYAYRLGAFLGSGAGSTGRLAGVVAAGLLSTDPTFLAHGPLATTDTAAAAGFLIALYYAVRYFEAPTVWRAAAAGVAGGLGVAMKFSVALAVPGLLLAMLATRWASPRPARPSLSRSAVHLACILVAALLTLWATYKFHVGPLGDSDTLASAPQWASLPPIVKETPVPMPSFWIGLARLAAHSATGSDAYLFGQLSRDGWWYYFPVLLLLKTPLALLVALAVSITLAFESSSRALPRWGLLLWGVLLPAGIYLGVSMASSVQIGIRHILPVLAALYVLCGVVLTRTRLRALVAVLLAGLAVIETARQHPRYLGYFNLLITRDDLREHVAADSNLDWGQDLKALADTLKANPALARQISAIYPLGTRQQPLFEVLGLDPALIDATPKPGSYIVVSVTRRALEPQRFEFLRNAKPGLRVGDGLVIYEMPSVRESYF